MNLDNYAAFTQIDTQNMLAQIDGLPDQLQAAWQSGLQNPLPVWQGIERVVLAGMGGSAIGADLLSAYIAPACPVPVVVHRNYGLPAWARGPHTLAICISHSGNTEESLSAFEVASEAEMRCLAIATGGALAEAAEKAGVPLWKFEHHGQPRAAVGFSFGLLLAALTRLGLIPDPSQEVSTAVAAMRSQQVHLAAQSPATQNLAKRLAGQLIGRWITVFGSDLLAPVARRWKGQINELAKTWAQFDLLPEADHNSLAGTLNPEDLLDRSMALFLSASSDHPRNRLRAELTRKALMLEGINTDSVNAIGENPLAQQWTCLHLGDYVAYYLAMAYEVDPTPISVIADFKDAMKSGG
ncbi:MAG: bifunctional phosphoglucose/phosphomannose isomerase [Omnitrophica WOR_2 bacterium]